MRYDIQTRVTREPDSLEPRRPRCPGSYAGSEHRGLLHLFRPLAFRAPLLPWLLD